MKKKQFVTFTRCRKLENESDILEIACDYVVGLVSKEVRAITKI